jgi:hypothetical protein
VENMKLRRGGFSQSGNFYQKNEKIPERPYSTNGFSGY